MLNHVLKVSSGTCQQSVEVLSVSNVLDFRISQGSVATHCMWCVHTEFSYESFGVRILKIGPPLQKKHSISKCTVFIGPPCILSSL